ncbi:hypothetical protein Q3G72_032286 [Acer saccharum]|nr:hypothetical protein Q3G72_032286 [Acer saccharum]
MRNLDGLTQAIVENACGRAMRERTTDDVLAKYEMLGQNSQQRSSREKSGLRERGANSELAMQVANLSKEVNRLVENLEQQQVVVCQACGRNGHGVDMCPGQGSIQQEEEA